MSREIDAEVAEKVMGLDLSKYPMRHEVVHLESRTIETWEENIPRYSTDIAAAFQVVEKMRALGWQLELHRKHNVEVIFRKYGERMKVHLGKCCGNIDATPHVICLAALAATKGESNG